MENHQPEHEQLYSHNNQDIEHADSKSVIPPPPPPGYRFLPTDEQLIVNYLKVFVTNPESGGVHNLIFAVNLYGWGPDELTAAHKEQCEGQWYFFTKRNRKYANGNRPDRAAGRGYWKQTNVVHHIFRAGKNTKRVKIGRKITLDYYRKRDSKEKVGSHTDWKMNEYRLDDENLAHDYSSAGTTDEFSEWCLCRLYKSAKTKNNNTQVNIQVEAEPSSGTQLIAPQEHNEHVAGELDTNFTGQSTAPSFRDQHIIAQEQYNGLNAGGPGLNFVQQSTTLPFNNNNFWNPNNSNYMENVTSGSMNGMHYTTADLLIDHQDIYPLTGTMHENPGHVQPIRSLSPSGFPTWSHYDINQSSSGIPDHVTSDLEFNFPPSSFPGNGESSFDIDFTFDDFDQFGNQDDFKDV